MGCEVMGFWGWWLGLVVSWSWWLGLVVTWSWWLVGGYGILGLVVRHLRLVVRYLGSRVTGGALPVGKGSD